MHEMTIAQSIIELAEQVALKEDAGSIESIDIEIGTFSGVVLESLAFAMEIAVKDTKLQKARINYLEKAGIACCNQCHTRFETNDLLTLCPDCHTADIEIIDGKQLKIKSLTI